MSRTQVIMADQKFLLGARATEKLTKLPSKVNGAADKIQNDTRSLGRGIRGGVEYRSDERDIGSENLDE